MRQKSIGGLDHELLENGGLLMPAKPRGKAIKAWKSLHKTLFLASLMCITSTYFISASVHFYEAVKGCLRRGSYFLAGLSDHPSKQENFMCQTFLNFKTSRYTYHANFPLLNWFFRWWRGRFERWGSIPNIWRLSEKHMID